MSKKALVTGGSRGIGAATVKKLIDDGYEVAFLYHENEEASKALATETGAKAVQCDLSDVPRVAGRLQEARAVLSADGFDVVVANAGVSEIGLFDVMNGEEWNHLMDVNLNGNVEVIRQCVPYMISAKCGSIVTVSSMWGQVGASCEVAYSTSKAALIGFTKALAKELGLSGIRVNCVAPGVIDTDMNSHLSAETLEELKGDIPLGRIGGAEEVAETIVFLASQRASYITGQIIGVNGGIVC